MAGRILNVKHLPADELVMYEYANSLGVKGTFQGLCINKLLWRLRAEAAVAPIRTATEEDE